MKESYIIFICLCLLTLTFAFPEWADSDFSTYEKEQQILDALLNSGDGTYDPRVPPGERDASPVDITATMYILDITSVNDRENEYSAQFYFRQSWKDPRLAFVHLGTDIPYLRVHDVENVWKPDSFFVQERQGKLHTVMMPNTFMRIKPNGEILFSVRLSMTFGCDMDLRYYPLDSQECSFSVESYGSKANEIQYKWGEVGVSNDLSLRGFSLSSFKTFSNSEQYTHGNYSRLEMNLKFQRKVGFFMNKLYVPFIILVITSWLSFWIRPQFVSLRLTLILTILFIMFWLESDVSRHTPPVSYTKAVDVWTGVCLSLVFASLLQFILVSQLARNEEERRKQRRGADPEALFIKEEGNNAKLEKSFSVDSADVQAISQLIAVNVLEDRQAFHMIDTFARIFYPLVFAVFNLTYWPVYCAGN